MTTKPIDYIDAMPAADLRTNLRNAYATTSALNREIEMLHGLVLKQREQIAGLVGAALTAEQRLIQMHAERLWNQHQSYDSAKAYKVAKEENPLAEVVGIRTAIAVAKGNTP